MIYNKFIYDKIIVMLENSAKIKFIKLKLKLLKKII